MGRITPNLPVNAYQTFQIAAPLSTHWRPATCEEVGCEKYTHGWKVRVEGLTPEMVHAAKTAGRKFKETRVAENETYLVFESGQPCFRQSQHRARVDRLERFLVRSGDFRSLGQPREHSRPEFWVEEFAENQDKLAQQLGRR